MSWVLLLGGCAAAPQPSLYPGLADEVRDFLKSYAQDLRAGNREAIASRYHSGGAFMLGAGRKDHVPFESLLHDYQTTWQAPVAFEWCDVSIQLVSPDAAVVAARFNWHTPNGIRQFSYSALLLRQNGSLRIRLEDESSQSEDAELLPCPPLQ